MRIDKLLAHLGLGSRKEVHELLKKGHVTVNGQIVTHKDWSVDPERDRIAFKGEELCTQQTYYIAFHKPAGVVTALVDAVHETVMDRLPPVFRSLKVAPVGRLDKDTEGLLLLTTDGTWAHRVIHGKKDVWKTYRFSYEGILREEAIRRIEEGILLEDGSQCKPATITLQEEGWATLSISEGKYHQVKRMMEACDCKVTYLQRLSIGSITLEGLEEVGAYRELTEKEVASFYTK